MKIRIPSPLRSYTDGRSVVDAHGRTIFELVRSLDTSYPGLRSRIIDEQDRIREHIKIYLDAEQIHDGSAEVEPESEIHIICALTGGSL